MYIFLTSLSYYKINPKEKKKKESQIKSLVGGFVKFFWENTTRPKKGGDFAKNP